MKFYELQKFWVETTNILNKTYRELAYRRDERIDKIIVWIVGFDVAAIGLLITASEHFEKHYTKEQISFVVILLVMSLVVGILSRVIMAVVHSYNVKLEPMFDSHLTGFLLPMTGSDLKDDETPETIIYLLENYFQTDANNLTQQRTFLGEQKYTELLRNKYNDAKDYYSTLNKAFREDILTISKDVYGYTDKELKELDDVKKLARMGKLMRIFRKISIYFYIWSLLALIGAVLVFSLVYVTF